MQQINQSHPKQILPYLLASILERASFYGLQSGIVIYMISKTISMSQTEAITVFSWYLSSLIVFQIIGGMLGDFILGNKKAIIIGGIIQAIGAFSLLISSKTGLYLGLSLFTLGNGLYIPNLKANFGKLYLESTKLLDAGFSIFYLSSNIGAIISSLLIINIGTAYDYNYEFVLVGFMILLSLIPIFLSKDIELKEELNKFTLNLNQRIVNILIIVFAVGLFWMFYSISDVRFFDIQTEFMKIKSLSHFSVLWNSSNSIFILLISIFIIVLWTKFYTTQLHKLIIGFVFGLISYGLLLYIPEVPNEHNVVLYFISLFMLAIGEVYISPIVNSIIIKYGKPKYFAILISLAYIPSKMLYLVFGLFKRDDFRTEPLLAIKIGFIATGIICFILITYYIIKNTNKSKLND